MYIHPKLSPSFSMETEVLYLSACNAVHKTHSECTGWNRISCQLCCFSSPAANVLALMSQCFS